MAGDASPEGGASSAPDLADLLKACGRGDQAAFAQLYDATSSRVVGLAVRVVRDPAQAEEVAQEAFLEIWKTSGRFDPAKGSPLGWLLTIVHRKAVDRVRSAEASTRRDTTYHQRNQPVEHDSTAEAAAASLEARRVRQALAEPHRRSSARHWSSPTSAATRTRRWRPCSTSRSAPPRPASGTGSSDCATPWGWGS